MSFAFRLEPKFRRFTIHNLEYRSSFSIRARNQSLAHDEPQHTGETLFRALLLGRRKHSENTFDGFGRRYRAQSR